MGNNIKCSIDKMSTIDLTKPTAPGNTYDETDIYIWKQEVGDIAKEKSY